MGKYVIKRLLLLIPILLGVSFIIFTIMNMIPGDVASLVLGDNAPLSAREELTREEQEYLESYLREIHEMVPRTPEESRLAAYMPLVTEEALKLPRQGVFLGDVIQEGNVSLVGALLAYAPGEEKKEEILKEIRASMRALLESQLETKRQDRKMVDRVSDLEATIREMSDGLGRKVDVEEVAEKMGVSEEEIEDILKLAGEEWKEE